MGHGAGEGGVGGPVTLTAARKRVKHRMRTPGGDEAEEEATGPDPADVWAALEQVSRSRPSLSPFISLSLSLSRALARSLEGRRDENSELP